MREKDAKELAANEGKEAKKQTEEKEAQSKANKKKDTIQDIAKEKKSWQEAGPEEALAFLKEKQDEYTPEAWSTLIKELKIPLMAITALETQKDNPGLRAQAIEVIAAAKAEFKETAEAIDTAPLEKSAFMRAYWTIARLLPHVYNQKNVEQVEKMALNLIKKHGDVENLDNLFDIFFDITLGVIIRPKGIINNSDLLMHLKEKKKLACIDIWFHRKKYNLLNVRDSKDLSRRTKWVSSPSFSGVILVDSDTYMDIISFTFQELKKDSSIPPSKYGGSYNYPSCDDLFKKEDLDLRRKIESLPFIFVVKARLARLRKDEAEAYYYEKAAQIHELWQRGAAYERNPKKDNAGMKKPLEVDWNMLVKNKRFDEGVKNLLKKLHKREAIETLLGNLINNNMIEYGKGDKSYMVSAKLAAEERPAKEITLNFNDDLLTKERGYFQREDVGKIDWLKDPILNLSLDMIDGLFALLGTFSIKATPSKGKLIYDKGKKSFIVIIEEVVLYVKDEFDFNDDGFFYQYLKVSQYLGAVDTETLNISEFRGSTIWNEQFRKYRSLTGKGCDLRVVATSDSMPIKPIKILCSMYDGQDPFTMRYYKSDERTFHEKANMIYKILP